MEHEWDFGDWGRSESLNGEIVRFVSCPSYGSGHTSGMEYFLRKNGHVRHLDKVEYLPDCTGWDWQPPKPIEPPEGYRLLADHELVGEGAMRIDGADREPRSWLNGNDGKCEMTVAEFKDEYPSLKILAVCRKIEPPEGCRLLGLEEVVLKGDLRYLCNERARNWGVTSYYDGTVKEQIEMFKEDGVIAYARKIEPQYRPFKDHVEFWQYRNMWITRIDCAGNQTDGYWKILGADETGVWGQCDKVSYADLLAKHKFVEQVGVDYDATIPCGVKL